MCTKRQLQSLLGSLLYVSKCVRYSRFFLNRLLETLRNVSKTYITLNADFQKDIAWFNRFLDVFNGTCFFKKQQVNFFLHLDACLTGLGGIFDRDVYHIPLPEKFRDIPIVKLEMLNILVAVRVWAKNWEKKCVKVFCDNQALVTILNSGRTRDPFLAAVTRNIFMVAATSDIHLKILHSKFFKHF